MLFNFRTSLTDLVVTDLDGTLWDDDCVVPAATRAALLTLERRGIPVLAATARDPYTAGLLLDRNRLQLPLVTFNGALGRDRHGSTFHCSSFSRTEAMQLLRLCRSHHIVPDICVADDRYLGVTSETEASSSGAEYRNRTRDFSEAMDLSRAVESMPVLEMCVVGVPRSRILALFETASALPFVKAYLVEERVYGKGWSLMFAPAAAGKWAGVEAYCRTANIDAGHVLAVGDGFNDVELIENAAIGCAMPWADRAVLDCADVVLSEGGWSEIVSMVDSVPIRPPKLVRAS